MEVTQSIMQRLWLKVKYRHQRYQRVLWFLSAVCFIYAGSQIMGSGTNVYYTYRETPIANGPDNRIEIGITSGEHNNGSGELIKTKNSQNQSGQEVKTLLTNGNSNQVLQVLPQKNLNLVNITSIAIANESTSIEQKLSQERKPGCYLGKYCVDYILKPEGHCSNSTNTKFLAFVLSRMANFKRRAKLRRTWANNTVFRDTDLRVVFILGKGKNYSDHEMKLQEEAKTFNDIVLVDFVDNYENLTFKTLLGLHWTTHYCPNASFVLKTDDDVFINMFSFLDRITSMIQAKKDKNVIMGYLWQRAWVRRTGKYWMSKEQYNEKYYPPYCGGSAYVMSGDVVKKLNELALQDKRTEFFRMEDIYVTGILARQAGVQPTKIPNGGYCFGKNRFVEKRWKDFIVWHAALTPQAENILWDKLLKLSGRMTQPKLMKNDVKPVQTNATSVQARDKTVQSDAASVQTIATSVQTEVHSVQTERKPGCYLGKYCVEYILKPEGHCSNNTKTKFLTFVLSTMENFNRRARIRRTWGNNTVFRDTALRVVFILGKGKNFSDHEMRIQEEAKTFNDIVLADFVDNYENLTFKTLLGLHWTTYYCPNASFVLKTDDDVFINTFSFLDRVTGMIKAKKDKNVIMGYLWQKAHVRRSGKYWVSQEQYKEKFYPPYCGGSAYVMSGDMVKKLNMLALQDKRTEFFRMEDIYVTGILARQAGVMPTLIPNWGYSFGKNRFVEKRWKDFIVWHAALKPKQEDLLWNKLLHLSGTVNQPVQIQTKPGCYLDQYCVEYILKPEGHCSNNTNTKFLAFVLSAMENFDRRERIRRTWGNNTVFRHTDLRVVFILGKGQNYSDHQKKLQEEAKTFNDIVLVDFVDNFENLTFKSLLGLHWTTHYCPNASFVLKTDDDVFINTFSFLDRVTGMIQAKKDKNVIMGYLWEKAFVHRSGKYWVSEEQYKDKFYPPYCGGSAYVMSGDVVKKLNELALNDERTEFFRIEDIYVTGILARVAGVKPTMIPNWGYSFGKDRFVEERWKDFIVWHAALSPKEKDLLWDKLLRLSGTITQPKLVQNDVQLGQVKAETVQPENKTAQTKSPLLIFRDQIPKT